MIKIVSKAAWLGLDEKRRQRGGQPAVIEVTLPNGNAVRFFSLSARDEDDADRINSAAAILTLSE